MSLPPRLPKYKLSQCDPNKGNNQDGRLQLFWLHCLACNVCDLRKQTSVAESPARTTQHAQLRFAKLKTQSLARKVQQAMFSMQSSARKAQHAKLGTQISTRKAQHAKSCTQSSARKTQHAKQSTQSLIHKPQHAKLSTQCAARKARHAKLSTQS